ncbi:uncharacterized protein I303_100241 [Kwoniella dejecticola CBS 10117]|uniref:Uncharacterized protein n=1 Tax=Kwoniella dejecticola CBS 10117 TaxID=1296121 RepID=A0A1A6AEC3_9TREE|nr:uncharacterized protein I303_00243 [Kwoniella dejecticola CBS 10117]OBR88426.1 hypothetical protein I303_00243 [Kwoniella dejecticola CBS 10117]
MQGHPNVPRVRHGYSPPRQPAYNYAPPPMNAVPPVPPVAPSISITPTPLVEAAAGPYGVTPSILPGPFILLLLLPSIPLLLFSLGARPPDTSHLPFSTSDVFTTGAFVTVTMTIVICLGVYPEAGGAVWEFIRDGGKGSMNMNMNERYWQTVRSWAGGLSGRADPSVLPYSSTNVRNPAVSEWMWKWTFDERYRRWAKIRVPAPASAQPMHIRPSPKGVQALTARHLKALREAFPNLYSEYKPRLVPSLLVISFAIFLVILLIGGVLGSAYDKDWKSSSSSGEGRSSSSASKLPSWVERELRKRKEEKPEQTLKRTKEESKKELDSYKKMKDPEGLKKFQKKREAEIEVLKKELAKRKLPLVGLEDKKKSKRSKSKDGEDRHHDKKKKKKTGDNEEESEHKSMSRSERVKNMLLGEKAAKKAPDTNAIADAGPGWEIADPSLAQNTLAKSEMNAQQMAQKLKGGG